MPRIIDGYTAATLTTQAKENEMRTALRLTSLSRLPTSLPLKVTAIAIIGITMSACGNKNDLYHPTQLPEAHAPIPPHDSLKKLESEENLKVDEEKESQTPQT